MRRASGGRTRTRGPSAVVVGHELAQQTPQVPLVEHDHIVKAFLADRANHSFGDRVLWKNLPAGDGGRTRDPLRGKHDRGHRALAVTLTSRGAPQAGWPVREVRTDCRRNRLPNLVADTPKRITTTR